MASAGALRVTFSGAFPYTHGSVMLQPLDWLEAGFRYTDIANKWYGESSAGDQTYKDKSIDIKLRLRQAVARHTISLFLQAIRDSHAVINNNRLEKRLHSGSAPLNPRAQLRRYRQLISANRKPNQTRSRNRRSGNFSHFRTSFD
jgi:hypothetical protein